MARHLLLAVFATRNLLTLGALEALQTVRALRIRVALTHASLQILGLTVVSATQLLDAAVQRIVAVVPIFAAAIALASGNLLALGALEALQALRALRIRVAFATARLQVLCTTVVAAAQVLVRGDCLFALGGAQVGEPFRAVATLGFSVRVHALACFVAAAVVFRAWVRLLHFDLRVVAVVMTRAATFALATRNRLTLGTLETFQTVRALRIRVAH